MEKVAKGSGDGKLSLGNKKLDTEVLEEDDEFEEFPTEEWEVKEGEEEEEEEEVAMWEDNWDDESAEDDFTKQLRLELEKKELRGTEAKR